MQDDKKIDSDFIKGYGDLNDETAEDANFKKDHRDNQATPNNSSDIDKEK